MAMFFYSILSCFIVYKGVYDILKFKKYKFLKTHQYSNDRMYP